MTIEESNLAFTFPPHASCIKFDDAGFYRDSFNALPGGKGVDFIVDYGKELVFVEVKNCEGFERENRPRTEASPDGRFASDSDTDTNRFDTEIPKKVAMTVACLTGAHSKRDVSPNAAGLEPYFQHLAALGSSPAKKELVVILFLEGDFSSSVRTKKTIMDRIQHSTRSKLKWLACRKVMVVDAATCPGKYFTVQKL